MKPPTRVSLLVLGSLRPLPSRAAAAPALGRVAAAALHSDAPRPANVVPVYGTGPPPEPPVPAATERGDYSRAARRTRQAEMLRQARDLRSAASAAARAAKSGGAAAAGTRVLKKRFWQDVHVREVNGAYEVHLDSRAVRHPTTKEVIRLPLSKPHLAHALALEWDLLTSAQQGTKEHLVPLTSLICRALDIAADDAAAATTSPPSPASIRASITTMLLRYLETDSLLCLAPAADPSDPASPSSALDDRGRSLRDVQEQALSRIGPHVSGRAWPGAPAVRPVLDGDSIMPRRHPPELTAAVRAWVEGLGHWELAALERATLAGKSLLVAARLLIEWSEGEAGSEARARATGDAVLGEDGEGEGKGSFGVEEAARAASIEVDWQIGRWGEVEDTHDVEREDIRRQLGSVVLLVSGNGSAKSRS